VHAAAPAPRPKRKPRGPSRTRPPATAGSISAQFLHAQLQWMQHHVEPKGVDARCLANLVWALAKLDLSSDEAALSTEIATNVAPFVLRSLGTSSPQVRARGVGGWRGGEACFRAAAPAIRAPSAPRAPARARRLPNQPHPAPSKRTHPRPPPQPQGLANMLWSYAKLPVAPVPVVAALAGKIATELQAAAGGDAKPFDAQALSNSIWALAHLKSRGMELEAFGPTVLAFLEAVAGASARMLGRLQQVLLSLPRGAGGAPDAGALLAAAEADFSCQALVNIAWALATVAGPACASHPPFRQLFAVVNAESIGRLRATAALLRARQPLPYHGGGGGQGFNEQALSNAVFAFDKAGLLTPDLLSAVFEVGVLRLQAGGGPGHHGGSHDGGGSISFKPQELCTLLKACHTGISPPWGFLAALLHALSLNPGAIDNWSASEKAELQRAAALFQARAAAAQAAAQGAADAALLAQLGLLEAQGQQQAAAAAAAAAALQQQIEAHAAAAQQGAAAQQQPELPPFAALLGGAGGGAPPRAGGGAAARPPPAALPPFNPAAFFGGRGPLPPVPPGAVPMGYGPPLSTAMLDAAAGYGGSAAGSSAGTSPRTPADAAAGPAASPFVGGAAPPLLGVDAACNKAQRARLAHAPPQHQALLFAQTQQRLANAGLSTSTAGSLWQGAGGAAGPAAPGTPMSPASPASAAEGAAAPPASAGGAVDAASLRPWLLDAAAALPRPTAAAGGGVRGQF
jgi:hypothetical protein